MTELQRLVPAPPILRVPALRVLEGFDLSPTPALVFMRPRSTGKSYARPYLTVEEKVAARTLQLPDGAFFPTRRGQCLPGGPNGARPCPWVRCAHHNYLDVTDSGAIKFNFPHLDVDEIPETCALDVADRGDITLEEAGRLTNLTRERVRQIEVRALTKLRENDNGLTTDDSHDQPE